MTAPKAQRAVASDEEMKPRIDGQGSSIGPSFFDVLRCEHLDADLYRSSQVSGREVPVTSSTSIRALTLPVLPTSRHCGGRRTLGASLVAK